MAVIPATDQNDSSDFCAAEMTKGLPIFPTHLMKMTRFSILAGIFVAFVVLSPASADPVKTVSYREFGAVGDGKTDDFEAIIKTHEAANKGKWTVKADAGATYYIGQVDKTALIQTDTHWGDARFVIDDSSVGVNDRGKHVFTIASALPPKNITNIKTLEKNQERLDLRLPQDAVVRVTDTATKRFIREGLNQNQGTSQSDVFLVDRNGNVDMSAPIIWDFEQISSMTAYPIDAETLTVTGGRFTTIANQAESKYTYYARGIDITRSNVLIEGLLHEITGELDHGAPYHGFLVVTNCAKITIKNCMLSGHKTYRTIGAAGKPVSMGSYDLSVRGGIHVTVANSGQVNSIHDARFWGIFTSNFSKCLTFDNVRFSRFDAHQGVTNATIRDSELGYMGIHLIGGGVFLVENSKIRGPHLVWLRDDYGSTFEGEILIRNCEFAPRNGKQSDAVLFNGRHSGKHDFGYPCFMPRKISIDGLVVNDVNPPQNYTGPKIFGTFNAAYKDESYKEDFPYSLTEEVSIKNLKIKSGKPWVLSGNPFLFRKVAVKEEK